ncbi:MAG: hypothetical protein HOL04_04180 [Gammaproteobacteria bacterium]|jgi:hypothetical protein|nr:hypothetical protein [Gammaproteobacteria bacterium]MBT4607591.1 hypothetical protein [Thiotrichales bacterium]MBT3966267.1 hypothetical protein [Gammaproteobacteria bacterium]MBT4329612.1 hypothetical protein [Gammaproteobacteria bacterium]MBT5360921.1 hypothetical protein [Gammaproteobacteria bacterium]
MRNSTSSPTPTRDSSLSSILVALLALILIASPLLQWWSSSESPWYTPYLLWAGLIMLIAALNRGSHRHVQ